MNLWAIKKDLSIKLLLLRLDEIICLEQFNIALNNELNARAVRFSARNTEGLSAYIYSYGQSQHRYGIHLELPSHIDNPGINSNVFEDISFEQLVDVLTVHFNLT